MTLLLYYSIKSNLTKDELIKMDKKVKNQIIIRKFVGKLNSNVKNKTKKIYIF